MLDDGLRARATDTLARPAPAGAASRRQAKRYSAQARARCFLWNLLEKVNAKKIELNHCLDGTIVNIVVLHPPRHPVSDSFWQKTPHFFSNAPGNSTGDNNWERRA